MSGTTKRSESIMASEDTLIGNDFKVMLGDGNSPEVFADLCAAFDFGSVGEEKSLIDVTSYCDDGRTYRNGLAEGDNSPDEYFEFAATVRGWNVTGPIGEKSVLTFTLKISGEVLWVQ